MTDLKEYGYAGADDGSVARVTAVHKERYEIVSARGFTYGKLKASVYFNDPNAAYPTAGDFVRIQPNAIGDDVIAETLQRKSYFTRKIAGAKKTAQAVAANFDYVFIATSLNHDFNVSRLTRTLVQAWQSGGTPVILLTKADLCPDSSAQELAAREAAPGVDIIRLSALTGEGTEKLAPYLSYGKTGVFLGSSGVGKSSLLNCLMGYDRMRVNVTRDVDESKGRHTTTYRQLVTLPSGGMIIDTPGMREMGLWDAEDGLDTVFSDVEELIKRCRFSDCGHHNEPGCAIRAAIVSGALTEKRWHEYQRLQTEALRSADPGEAARRRQARNKAIAQYSKNRSKTVW